MESIEQPNETQRSKGYLLFLFIFLCFMEIFDTYTTQYPNVIVSKVQAEFLSHLSPIQADSTMALVVALASIGMLFVVINQVLADVFGRRIFLFITMFGMGVASLVIFFSQSIIQYGISLFFLYIFFSSDIWTIYISEECRKERRGLNLNLILVFGVIGALLVPTFRSIFLPEDTSTNWQGMTYFAFLAIPISFLVIWIKETRKFDELKKTQTQKATPKENLRKFIKPFGRKYRTAFLPILVMSFLQGLNYTFIQLGEAFISDHITGEQVNWVITAMGVAAIIGYLLTGILSDTIGRKPMFIIYSILLPASIALSVFGATSSYAFIALLIGASLASLTYWSLGVVNRLISIEILPTDIRGTGTAIRSVLTALGTILGGFLNSWLITKVTLGPSFFIVSLVLLINIPLILIFIKETKSIELELS
ncbi:MAG: MFS transporter [Candidatus Lokiarchaeota archaeon]|nr:MFS transporter [Candidatus Lokiarchaeota archaeon]